jgi:hypothetical protein
MRPLGLLAAWTATLYFISPAVAWNATGHRVIAAIAYEHLTPLARTRVNEMLKHHPDYATLLTRNAPDDADGRARAAFIGASDWSDAIKGDPRFYDDTRQDAQPTPLLPGFRDMKRHTNWHYYDTPYAPDGAHVEKQKPPNALTELPRLLRDIGKPLDSPANPVYDLPWLEHIEGDVHQPLHCVSRFLKSEPKGDAGGNGVFVAPRGNLHSLWDNAAGTDASDENITKLATEIAAEHPVQGDIRHQERNPKKWIEEGFKLAKSDVYTFGLGTGSREHPLQLPAAYLENAKRVARAQIALAGYRLAAVLNDRLK